MKTNIKTENNLFFSLHKKNDGYLFKSQILIVETN